MKKIFLLCFISCVAGVAAFGMGVGATDAQDDGRAGVYYRDGARFALEGRLAEAAKAFEQAISLDPKNGNAFYSLGNVYLEMGRWADAINAYYRAISLNKNDVEAYNALGIALGMRGQDMQAAAAFERAIKIYPKWAEPYYNLSQARRRLRQDEAAQAAYERAIRLRPDYATHPPQRFTAAVKNADLTPRSEKAAAANAAAASGLPEAIFSTPSATPEATARPAATRAPADAADSVARHDSTDAKSYFDIGVKQARAGRYEEATVAFRRAIILDRNNSEAYRGLGDAYAALGRWRESVDAYEQAARLNPNDPETYQRLGRAYAKLRETTPAPETAPVAAKDGEKEGASSGATVEAERAKGVSAATGSSGATAEDDIDPTAVYRVGPGDVLDVRVFDGRERRTTSYEVTPTGLLAYPALSEPLKVAGLTTEQVAARLSAELKRRGGAPADTAIAVGVRDYVSHAVIVSGMVKDAGTKILQREGVPLYAVIAYAQPLAGAGQAVVAARATGRVTTVDLLDVQAMKMLVRPGDVITVGVRAEQFFYIAGAVRQPGQKKFHAGLTLTQAVLAAGGATTQGAAVAVISRQAGDGRLQTTKYDLKGIGDGKMPDPLIQAGDRIEVLR